MTTIAASSRRIVHLLGGAGKTGRRVATRLAATGHGVRLASRSSELRFDWADPQTYGPALAGADAAYLAYYPDISFPGAAADIRRVAEAAAAQQVRRLVLSSQLSGAIGRRVSYLPVAADEYAHAARAAGVPEDEIEPLVDLFTRVLDGHNATLTPDLAETLGRPGGTFADYCRRTAATGVWDVAVRAVVG